MKIKNKKTILIILLTLIGVFSIILIGNYFFGSYDVTFDSKGGTSVAVERVYKGSTATEPNTPVLKGYVFDGWYLNNEKFDFSTPITENITLTGKWKSVIQE